MTNYLTIPTPFDDANVLLSVITKLVFPKAEIHPEAVPLKDASGQPQNQLVHLIIPAEKAKTTADIGLWQNNNGTFSFIFSEADYQQLCSGYRNYISWLADYYLQQIRNKDQQQDMTKPKLAEVKPPFLNEQHRNKVRRRQLDKFWRNGVRTSVYLSPAGYERLGRMVKNSQFPLSGTAVSIDSFVSVFLTNYEVIKPEALDNWWVVADQYCINQICASWELSRDPKVEEMLVKQNWVATEPALTKILTAFKTDQPERLDDLQAKDFETLLLAVKILIRLLRKKPGSMSVR